jgi:hypothetical protein
VVGFGAVLMLVVVVAVVEVMLVYCVCRSH